MKVGGRERGAVKRKETEHTVLPNIALCSVGFFEIKNIFDKKEHGCPACASRKSVMTETNSMEQSS